MTAGHAHLNEYNCYPEPSVLQMRGDTCMQTHLKGRQTWLVLGILMLTLTACSTSVTRVPGEAPVDLGGRWNDTDSRLTAEALIKDALDHPWSQRFTQVAGRKPAVVVGTVLNRTHEQL